MRERLYDQIMATAHVGVVVIPAGEIDAHGLHKCNIAGMRRAVARLSCDPGYILTDGFPVPGLPAPSLAVWKGDQVAACVAAASIVAKVTRDRLMVALDADFPRYGFADHKGYVTRQHRLALETYGPCSAPPLLLRHGGQGRWARMKWGPGLPERAHRGTGTTGGPR